MRRRSTNMHCLLASSLCPFLAKFKALIFLLRDSLAPPRPLSWLHIGIHRFTLSQMQASFRITPCDTPIALQFCTTDGFCRISSLDIIIPVLELCASSSSHFSLYNVSFVDSGLHDIERNDFISRRMKEYWACSPVYTDLVV